MSRSTEEPKACATISGIRAFRHCPPLGRFLRHHRQVQRSTTYLDYRRSRWSTRRSLHLPSSLPDAAVYGGTGGIGYNLHLPTQSGHFDTVPRSGIGVFLHPRQTTDQPTLDLDRSPMQRRPKAPKTRAAQCKKQGIPTQCPALAWMDSFDNIQRSAIFGHEVVIVRTDCSSPARKRKAPCPVRLQSVYDNSANSVRPRPAKNPAASEHSTRFYHTYHFCQIFAFDRIVEPRERELELQE
ncbi:hypothetical protein THAOC_35294 [Thalassiosira oceanica]|uniref:Uncharacterized protein n=1 Tax=Thalassiosira oceanica TaxID=159749 RepID=K0R152_THAOC|nr:hypothetical protein THAOC_35294 [Thalassiosira oceanica]|eukprot:EJK46063.1 hypothetical protein THAOC_35294 [Thalassiosira oceanica]